MSIFRNIPHWRSARYSPSENRLIFDAETGDASRRHEVAIDESEKHESHEKVRDQMNKFRAANKEFQEKAKASLDLAVKTHEGVLNQKLNAQMGLFMSTEQFTKADPDKKQDLIKTRSASLARDMAARFNQRSLGQDLLATVIVDADGVSNIKLELKPQTPVEQKTDKPADASKDAGAEKKTDEKKPDGKKEEPPKPKEGEAKGAPDQKLLDDTRAKLLPNTKRALETLTVQDQTVALRALAAMPKDQAKIEQFLADPVNAAQVKTILGNAGMIAGMSVDALLPMVRGKNKPTPQDQENAALLKRFATTIMHAKQGPITSPESISDRPEPKTEEERLNRAIDDGLAALKDPNLSGTQKLAAGLAALGAFMQLIKLSISSPELLKAAPQVTTNKETKPSPAGKPGETLPGDSKEAQADKPSRVALEKKAHDKGMNLSQYYMVRKDEQSTEKAHTEELTGKVASAEAQEKTWNARVTELEARNKQKGKDKTPENDAELAEAKGQLAKAKETVSQLREQLKDAKEALKAVTADVEAMEALGRELSAMQDRAKDILKTAKQFLSDANGKPIAGAEDILGVLEAGLGGLVISEETLNINITLNDTQMTILRNTCRKYGFTGKNEELGMDASSNVKDINVFVKMLDQLTDKILNNAGVLKEAQPKPAEKPKEEEKKPEEGSDPTKKPQEEPVKKPEEGKESQKEEKKEQEAPQQLLQQKIYKVMYNISEYGIDGADTKNSMAELNTMKPSAEILKAVLDNAPPMLSKTDNCHYKLVHLNDAFGIAFDASATRQAVQSRVQRSIALLHTALLDPHMYPEGIVRQLSNTLIALRDNGEPDLQKTCTDLLSAAKFRDKQGKELTFSVDPQTLHVVLEKNPLEVAKEDLESRGMEYLTALGFVRTQEGSPYLKPKNGPIQDYPIVVLTDGWKVFMSSSVGGPTDPISITPENALESYSLSSERKSLMENLAKLNAQYRETVEQAKQRRSQS